MEHLTRRTAVVIGGTKGLGLETSKRLITEGYQVAITGRDFKKVDKELLPKAEALLMKQHCELNNPHSIKNAITNIYDRFGSIDVIINCAGILDKYDIEKITLSEWNEIVAINLTAPFFVIQEALPYLKSGKHPRVINISSNAGRMGGFENGAAYAATKGGLISMTYNLARKLAPHGITVNCVAPGPFQTDMFGSFSEDSRKKVLDRIPINRIGTTDEVVTAIMYFAGEHSSFTTGAVLDINGGIFMG